MKKQKEFEFATLENLLIQFIKGKSGIIKDKYKKNTFALHYYNEIVRNWNWLNYILIHLNTKTEKDTLTNLSKTAKNLYILYRYYKEKTNLSEILKEIPDISYKNQFIKRLKQFSFEKLLKKKTLIEQLSLSYAYPTFFIKNLLNYLDIDFLKNNLIHMNYRDPKTRLFSFCLNKLKITNQEEINLFLAKLKNNGINVFPDEHFPSLFHTLLKNKKKIVLSEEHKTGKLLLLDKASLIVANLLDSKEGEFINDYCAAPGIKSFLLAQLTNNNSKIIASEFLYKRTKQMNKVINRISSTSIFILNCDSIIPPTRLNIKFDKILIDAPCTGTGALFSNPELKWRQNSNFLNQNIVLQTKLLNSAINNLKPGGILVYSTCSLYAEEGEMQILKFLDRLEPMNLPKWLSPSYQVEGNYVDGTGRLFPSIHFTKGFFIGKFKKKE